MTVTRVARADDRASQRRLAYWLIAPAVVLMLGGYVHLDRRGPPCDGAPTGS